MRWIGGILEASARPMARAAFSGDGVTYELHEDSLRASPKGGPADAVDLVADHAAAYVSMAEQFKWEHWTELGFIPDRAIAP